MGLAIFFGVFYFKVVNPLPQKLFKYVRPERIDILTNLQICFNPPLCFNDPFEMRLSIEGIDDEARIEQVAELAANAKYRQHILQGGKMTPEEFSALKKEKRGYLIESLKPHLPEIRRRATDRQVQYWEERLCILCLSETENNLLMWAHYTDSHKGMVIEFDPQHPFFNQPDKTTDLDLGFLTPVIYSQTRPILQAGGIPAHLSALRTKSDHWKYEQEWRVYQFQENCDKKDGSIHLFNIPSDSILRVVTGCRMETGTQAELIKAVRSNPHLSHVEIQKATLDLAIFDLNYTLL